MIKESQEPLRPCYKNNYSRTRIKSKLWGRNENTESINHILKKKTICFR